MDNNIDNIIPSFFHNNTWNIINNNNNDQIGVALEDHDNNGIINPFITHPTCPSSSSSSFPSLHHLSSLPPTLSSQDVNQDEEEEEELGAMKETMYKIAVMQPVDIDPATVKKPKRRNVRISDDPQSVTARLRRERISERIRILQRLVPGGTKMDTASMLDEAIRYTKFLKRQIKILHDNSGKLPQPRPPPPPSSAGGGNYL